MTSPFSSEDVADRVAHLVSSVDPDEIEACRDIVHRLAVKHAITPRVAELIDDAFVATLAGMPVFAVALHIDRRFREWATL